VSRTILIAEAATTHGGDLSIAADLIAAAADAGADYVKFQTYSLERLNPRDPQADWLRQAHLDRAAHERLMEECVQRGIQFLSTPFCADSLQLLRDLGLTTFKIASSEAYSGWWAPTDGEQWFVSFPWGVMWPGTTAATVIAPHKALTAIPLYPTPLEAVGRAQLLSGWSDHTCGLDACLWALARGVEVLEVHITLGGGRGRQMPWDKLPADFTKLRQFAESIETIRSGVSQTYRERWSA
jgi:N,N'-diacetyllegionaminate synthase